MPSFRSRAQVRKLAKKLPEVYERLKNKYGLDYGSLPERVKRKKVKKK